MSLFGKHEYNHHYNMDEFQQEKSRIGNDGGKGNAGEASFSGEHGMAPGASTSHGMPSTSSHKLSDRFYCYVTLHRNLSEECRKSPTLRRTCPICNEVCGDPDAMLQHLMKCPATGYYTCHESGNRVKIGKCETPGCLYLQGRITTAVNNIVRRLTPLSSRRRRRANSKKSSSSVETTEGGPNWDQSYPDGAAELHDNPNAAELSGYQSEVFEMDPESNPDMNAFDMPPAYVPSGSDPMDYAELPTQPQYSGIELDNNSSSASSESWNHSPFEEHEAIVQQQAFVPDNHTQTQGQRLFGISTPYSAEDQSSTVEQQQVTDWERALFDPLGNMDEWQGLVPKMDPEPLVNMDVADALFQNTRDFIPGNFIPGPSSFDLMELISPATEQGYPRESGIANHDVSPMVSGTSTDGNWGNSVFSDAPSSATRDTTISSLGSVKIPENSYVPPQYFRDEPGRMFSMDPEEEPESMGPLSTSSKHGLYTTVAMSMTSYLSQDTFSDMSSLNREEYTSAQVSLPPTIKQGYKASSMTPSLSQNSFTTTSSYTQDQQTAATESSLYNISYDHPGTPDQHQIPRRLVLIPRKPVSQSAPLLPTRPLSPDIKYMSTQARPDAGPLHDPSKPYHCSYCPSSFNDKSNHKRHQDKTCTYNPANLKKSCKCHCGKGFGRSDALAFHQRTSCTGLKIRNSSPPARVLKKGARKVKRILRAISEVPESALSLASMNMGA